MLNLKDKDIETAPCLAEGPLAVSGRKLIAMSRELGDTPGANLLRATAVPFLFDGMERIFATNEEPTARIVELFDKQSELFVAAQRSGFTRLGIAGATGATGATTQEQVVPVTDAHYGKLFEAFSKEQFWEEPLALLRARLERNNVDLPPLSNAKVLDAGCGGGRYSVAWRKLGAKHVTGIDITSIGVANAQKRVEEGKLDGVEFKVASALELPFEDKSFDIVFSNGVLQHSTDWKKGVQELLRVLKPNGFGFLYLIEKPGGLLWDVIEILRVLLAGSSKDFARNTLALLGIPANRIYYMLDHVMVPINVRSTPQDVEATLAKAGATKIRRLTRGTDYDRLEQIYQRVPYAEVKFGVGENRYIFSK